MTSDTRKPFSVNRRTLMAGTGALGAMAALSPKGALAQYTYLNGPVVETTEGRLRGLAGDNVHVFRGIRYGAPTGGENRFMPPKKPGSWSGVYEAVQFGPVAPQFNPAEPRPTSMISANNPPLLPENEDCLRLNIYTSSVNPGAKQPVMVWLHGGGFSSGAGSMRYYHAENMARSQGVTVVTINHRLNVFGFTHLADILGEDFAASGNVGMLDAVRALEWVRDNIENFGGDPDNVTIFGQSGGGSKVSTLMAMPDAKGLFHRAIVMSGPGITQDTAEQSTKAAEALLKTVGLNRGQARELQNLPMKDLLAGYFEAQKMLGGGMGGGGFNPVVDGEVLPRHPFDPDAPDMVADVPLMIGSTRDEATFFFRNGGANPEMGEDEMRKRLSGLQGLDMDEAVEIYRQSNPDATPWQLYILIFSNYTFGVGSIEMAERKAQQPAPVYMYRFDWDTDQLGGHMGAMHTLEIPFVYNNLDKNRWLVGGYAPQALADRMSGAWAAFARSGDPNIDDLPGWPAYIPRSRSTMIFNTECQVVDNPNPEEIRVVAEALGYA